jgi:hypothetical protein
MKLRVRNFPHPVLNPVSDDFEVGSFKGKIVGQREENELLVFLIEFNLKNPKLKELIEEKKAKYNIHFECITTMQRLSHSEYLHTFEVSIPSNLLNKKVDVNFFILAEEEINDYTNEDAHKDFEGINFKIKKGDILAYSESQTIHIEKKPMSNTHSIFKVTKDTDPGAPAIKISLNDHQIDIALPEVSYNRVANLKAYGEDCNKVLISMLYLPSLIDTLFNVQSIAKDEYLLADFENYDWYRTLEKKLETMGYDIVTLKLEDITRISYEMLNDTKESAWIALESIVFREEVEKE